MIDKAQFEVDRKVEDYRVKNLEKEEIAMTAERTVTETWNEIE
jgi:hypothetical protein